MTHSIAKSIIRLALPIFIGQIALMANGIIDTIMAGRISAVDQAAVGIGMSVYFSVFVPFMGVLLAISPAVAHLYGANNHAAIGEEVRQGLWLTLFLALPMFLLIYFPEPFLRISQLTPEVEAKTRAYLQFSAWGALAQLLFRLFYGFTTAISRPRIVMKLSIFALAIKVPLNFVFMYGYLGFSAMGGVGCAVATMIAVWVTAVVTWYMVWRDADYRRYQIFAQWSRPTFREQTHLLKLGIPIGVIFLVDVTSFTFMALFIARLGATASAAHGIATNLAAFSYMLPMALGIAVSVLIGQALGGKDPRLARRTGKIGFALAAACAVAFAVLIAGSSSWLTQVYTRDLAVRALATQLLLLVAVYHIVDALLAMGINALRGYKVVLVPLLVCAVCLWGLGLWGGWLLGLQGLTASIQIQPLGVPGFWYAAIGGFALASFLVAGYFWYVSGQRIHATE
ncbi:MAG: MATE family efflux transporter [Burkholderiales bacterium]